MFQNSRNARTTAAPSDRELTFFDLPPEIRDQIYTLVVVKDTNILLPPCVPVEQYCLREPALVATHPQWRAEALPIYYGQNIFQAPSYKETKAFLRALCWNRLPMLRSIRAFDAREQFVLEPSDWFDIVLPQVRKLMGKYGQDLVRSDAILFPLVVSGEMYWISVLEIRGFRIVLEDGFERLRRNDDGVSVDRS